MPHDPQHSEDTAARARAFAVAAHGDQQYAGQPYVVHLDAVAALVAPWGDEARAVAFLHDTVEDTPGTIERVREAFGDHVAARVALLTDEPGGDRDARKAKTNAKLAQVGVAHQIALVVKAADRLANLRTSAADPTGSRKWEMYRREHPAFRAAAYRPGLCDALWAEMEQILSRPPGPTPASESAPGTPDIVHAARVEWLERSAFFARIDAIGSLPGPPQTVVVGVDDPPGVAGAIPVAPADKPDDESFAGPVHRWYGKLGGGGGGRYFTLDVELPPYGRGGCTITTTYPADAAAFDWTMLCDLAGLPGVVRLDHAWFVQSRAQRPTHVVYRRDPRGFDAPVYRAASAEDAGSLLAHLRAAADPWPYEIGDPEPAGLWELTSAAGEVVGSYADRATALSVACGMSQAGGGTMHVANAMPHSASASSFTVRAGRVMDDANGKQAKVL